VSCVKIVDHVSERVDRSHRLALLVKNLFDGLTIVQKLLTAVVFVTDLEDFKLVGGLHTHLLAYHHLQIFDFGLVDRHEDLYLLQVGQQY
jgi:hypothetical protein